MTDIARLNIQVDSSSARRASTDLNRMRNTGRQTESRMASMTRTAMRLGTAIAGAFVVRRGVQELTRAISVYSDYQAQLAKVQAVSRATSDEMERMEKTIRHLGATTRFSASQAAEGTQFLAMAGFEVNEIIGALPGVLQLATAGGIDLGRAADIASNALTAMRLEVSELSRVNDVFVKTITTSNTDMEMLAQSFKYAGSVGAAFGYEVEEIAGYLGKMGDAGIQGSMGGTQLAMALQKASDVFEHYGVQAGEGTRYTNNLTGAMRLLEERGATAEEVMKIFGERAGRGVAAMLGQGIDSIEDYIESLYDAEGTTKQVSETMSNTLEGDFLALRSAIESVQISIGENLVPRTREYVQVLTEWIRNNETLIGQKVDQAVMKTVGAMEGLYKIYSAIPDFIVGPAGIGIVGAVLFGGKFGLIVGTIALINSQLEKLDMGISSVIRNYERLKDNVADSWQIMKDIHDGRRDFWSGELKSELEMAEDTLKALKEDRENQKELAGFGSDFAVEALKTIEKKIQDQKQLIQQLEKQTEQQKDDDRLSRRSGVIHSGEGLERATYSTGGQLPEGLRFRYDESNMEEHSPFMPRPLLQEQEQITPRPLQEQEQIIVLKPKIDKDVKGGFELVTPEMIEREEEKIFNLTMKSTGELSRAVEQRRDDTERAYREMYRDLGNQGEGYYTYEASRIDEQYEHLKRVTQDEVLAHQWKIKQLKELYSDLEIGPSIIMDSTHSLEESIVKREESIKKKLDDLRSKSKERQIEINQAYEAMYSDLRTKTTGYYDWEEQKIYEQYEYLKQVTGDEVLAYQWKYEQILALNDQFNTDMDSRSIETVGEMERAFTGWASTMSSQLNEIVWQADTSFKDIARSFAKMLTQMAIQKAIVAPMLGGVGGLLDSAFGLAHTGGIIGKDTLPERKLSDGLKSDEYPVILQKGEAVFTKEQLKALSNALPQDAVRQDDELKRAFASAQRMHSGLVPSNMGSNDKSPNMAKIEVNVINKTGTSADASVTEPKFDGERWVMSVVLDAAHRNRGGFAKGLKTALGKS